MKEVVHYADRVVAFVDILGFGDLVSRLATDPSLHAELQRAMRRIHSVRQSSLRTDTAQSDLEVSVFSDSIAISAKSSHLFSLIWSCGYLQADLLYLGILSRGGISIGPTFHADAILYGEGVLRAYRLESIAAIYPRIVVDEQLLDTPEHAAMRRFLTEDSDGMWSVDVFKFDATSDSAEALAADGYDPRDIYFEEVEKRITAGLAKATKPEHRSKWKWVEKRCLAASQQYRSERQKLRLP